MGQKINPIAFRLTESQQVKWSLKENYSDCLHSDIEIKDYVSNFFAKKDILVGGTVIKRGQDTIHVYSYVYPLDKSIDYGNNPLENTSMLKKVLSFLTKQNVQFYLINMKAFLPTKGYVTLLKQKNALTRETSLFLRNKTIIKKNLSRYRRRVYFEEALSILDVAVISQNADILSQFISHQLEKDFRHNLFLDFINKSIQEYVTFYPFLKGIRVQVKGRVNGSERSRKENFQTGSISLQTISNKLKYSTKDVYTIYGVCGLKIWMCFDN